MQQTIGPVHSIQVIFILSCWELGEIEEKEEVARHHGKPVVLFYQVAHRLNHLLLAFA